MSEQQPKKNPDYGVRLTGEELAAHQQQQQSQPGSAAASEYGPQGQQPASEYGQQGGQQPPYSQPGYQQPGYQQPGIQQPGYQQPGFQQPGYQQPGFQQPGFQQPTEETYAQRFGGPQLSPEMAQDPVRPKVLNISFWSIISAGIAYLLTQLVIVSLPNRGYSDQDIQVLEDVMSSMAAELPFDSVVSYLNSPMMTAAIIGQGVIFLVAYVLVALGIRNGWRSMRIIGTIFAVLSLFNFTFVSPLAAVLSSAAVILGIVGIVYSWLPASTEYFRKKAWQKAAKRAYPDVPSR